MNLEDFGINSGSKRHSKCLTAAENRFLGILWTDHVGSENKISANELAIKFDCAMEGFEPGRRQLQRLRHPTMNAGWLDTKKRTVRHFHNHLLTMHDNISILSKAGNDGGYWIAESKDEAIAFYDTFRKRGMTGLVKASRGKKAALIDMMEQVTFEFEDLVADVGISNDTGIPGDPAAIAVVDSFLARMLENPEKFSTGLKKLSEKYGSVLLPKARVEAMQKKAAELQELVLSLQV